MTDERDPIIEQLGAYGDALESHLEGAGTADVLPSPVPIASRQASPRRPVLLAAAAAVVVIAMLTALVLRSRTAEQDVASGTKEDAMRIVFKSADDTKDADTFHFTETVRSEGSANKGECSAPLTPAFDERGGVDNRSHVAWQGQSDAATVIATGTSARDGATYVARSTLPADWPVDKPWVKADAKDGQATIVLLSKGGKDLAITGPSMGRPGDKSSDPRNFLDSLEKVARSIDEVGTEQVRGENTKRYHATLDAQKVLEATISTKGPGGTAPIRIAENGPTETVDIWIGDDGLVRRMENRMTMQGLTIVSTLELFDYGTTNVASVPAASDVTDVGDLPASLIGVGPSPSFTSCGAPPGMPDKEQFEKSMNAQQECMADEFRKKAGDKTWRQYRAEHPGEFPDVSGDGPNTIMVSPSPSTCAISGSATAVPGSPPISGDGQVVCSTGAPPSPPVPSIPQNGPAPSTPDGAPIPATPPSTPANAPTPTVPPAGPGVPAVAPLDCPPPIDDAKMQACMQAMDETRSSGVVTDPSQIPKECEGILPTSPPSCPPTGPDGTPVTCGAIVGSPGDPNDPKVKACMEAIEKQAPVPAPSDPSKPDQPVPQIAKVPPECEGVLTPPVGAKCASVSQDGNVSSRSCVVTPSPGTGDSPAPPGAPPTPGAAAGGSGSGG